MQIKKKVSARNSTSSGCRSQRKAFWNVGVVPGKKILKLIRSSAKKKCNSKFFPVMRDVPCSRDLDSKLFSAKDEMDDAFLSGSAVDGTNNDFKGRIEGITHHALDTIFSPAFHISKYVALKAAEEGTVTNGMDMDSTILLESSKLCRFHVSQPEINAVRSCFSEDLFDIDLPPTSSPQHSEIDTDYEDDDSVDTRDFSSYLFIRNLPVLSSVVPTHRCTLLPKQTRNCPPTTLVLDLDETLVHSQLSPISDADFTFPIKFEEEECTVYVRCRPHLKEFLEKVSSLFEVVIFTASNRIYAEPLLNILDPKRKLLKHRLFRESCLFVGGSYLKDLSVLGRDLARVVIVDNSPEAFGFQVNNGIQIESWFEDRCDQELVGLVPVLETLAKTEDVRPLIAKKFGLEEKIAAAVILQTYTLPLQGNEASVSM